MTEEASRSGQPATGYAPISGLQMYYEIQGRGEIITGFLDEQPPVD